MKTANGIELNLNESNYCFSTRRFIFTFSSEKYLEKFKLKYKDFADEENLKFCLKYKISIDLTDYFYIVLYHKIETRGFRVYDSIKEEYINTFKIINL